MILEAHHRLRRLDAGLVLVDAQPAVERTFAVAGLAGTLTFAKSSPGPTRNPSP